MPLVHVEINGMDTPEAKAYFDAADKELKSVEQMYKEVKKEMKKGPRL